MRWSRREAMAASCGVLAVLLARPVRADSYPSQIIKMIVPYPAGGTTDLLGRLVADQLQIGLPATVIVENKPGAGTTIGAEQVARAQPDGYTLLMATSTTLAINKTLYKNLPYDPVKDFTPIALVAGVPFALIVNPSVPAKTLQEFIAYAKSKPGLTYGSAGNGSPQHLGAEMLKAAAGIDIRHVAYRGSVPAMLDVIAGHIPFMVMDLEPALPQIRDGKVRVLGVTTAKRVAAAPDIPTLAEAGLPGFELLAWQGVVGPAGMPRPIVDRLAAQIGKLLAEPATREKLRAMALEPLPASTPDSFAAYIKTRSTVGLPSSRRRAPKWNEPTFSPRFCAHRLFPIARASFMTDTADCDVLIIGAGPVGLTLAIDLAWRGVDVTVVESRARAAPPEPKCNHVAARTMEIFRRLGLSERVRNAGLPADYPHDISYRTSFTGPELTRIRIPCRRDRFTMTDGPDCNWPTPEPPHRINQIFLEPILFEHAAAQPRIRIFNRTTVEEVTIDDNGACVSVRDLESGSVRRFVCRYLAGCDGARSVVRKAMGAELSGDAVIQRVQSTYIRAPGLIDRQQHASAWGTGAINPRRSGMVYAIDGRERWLVHNYLKPGETDFESVDRDACIRTILGVDADFTYTVISKEDWFGRRLIANRFRHRCAFIAGDAAHIWVPYAGYGMNAGIADAMNLSWMLAAHLNGWAPRTILDAYEAERWPITSQVSRFAMSHAEAEIRRRGAVPDEIEQASPRGEAARADVGRLAYEINVQQYACTGLNFGTYYDRSPIIAYDGAEHPGYTMDRYTPSTVPGCRTPHAWSKDGASLYDRMGPEFTLLRLDPTVDASALMTAARSRNLPLALLDIDPAEASVLDGVRLVLSRPDQHVAWRGNSLPRDPLALIDHVRGAADDRSHAGSMSPGS